MTSVAPPAGLSDPGRRAWDLLVARPVAHRGLWATQGPPENSLAAFEAACAAGYGIELDVQLSADGEAMVFHDDRLDRMTAEVGRMSDLTAARLSALPLLDTDQTIPTLSEALATIAGRSLVLVELKVLGGEEGPLEARVAEVLDGYGGPFAIIGFNPGAIGWFAAERPGFLRGLNSTAYQDATQWTLPAAQRAALARLEHVGVAYPHFLSLGLDMLPSPEAAALREKGMPVACWTVRSPADWRRVSAHCDTFMFEGWRP